MGYSYQVWGELDKSDQCLKEAFNISKGLDDTQLIISAGLLLGMYYFDRGEYVKAREILEKRHEVLKKGGYKGGIKEIFGFEYLFRTYIELGEIERAMKLIDNMDEFALQVRDKEYISIADALRGMQFRAEKKWKESIDHFEKSLKESEDINLRQWSAYWFTKRVLVEYARVYLERDQEGDREKAHKLLDEALGIFQKIGAKGDMEKVIAKKKLLTA